MKKWIPGVITGGVLFVSVVTILSAVGVIRDRDVPVQTAAPAQMDADEKSPLPSPDSGHAPGEAGLSGKLIIGEEITSIGGSAFCDCSGLTGITIPDSVMSIGEMGQK